MTWLFVDSNFLNRKNENLECVVEFQYPWNCFHAPGGQDRGLPTHCLIYPGWQDSGQSTEQCLVGVTSFCLQFRRDL